MNCRLFTFFKLIIEQRNQIKYNLNSLIGEKNGME